MSTEIKLRRVSFGTIDVHIKNETGEITLKGTREFNAEYDPNWKKMYARIMFPIDSVVEENGGSDG